MATHKLMKATLVVPRRDLPTVTTELSKFHLFHMIEEERPLPDPTLKDLAQSALEIFNNLDELAKAMHIKEDKPELIKTLIKGDQQIAKEKLRAKNWSDFVSKLEVEAKQIIEEFRNIRTNLDYALDNSLKLKVRKLLSLREASRNAHDVLTTFNYTGDIKRFATIKGFFPRRLKDKFDKIFSKWILFTEDIEKDIPVLMNNHPLIRAFETITFNQGPPGFGEFDPTPLITLTFPIFYGIMFGDFGHGIILTLFGLLLYFRGYDSLKQWGIMLTVAGLSAAVVGFMIGEVFGLAIGEIIPGLENPLLEIIERSHGATGFNMEAVTTILIISILIGIVHLTIGFGLDVFKAVREKEYVEATIEKIPTLFLYLFGILFALAFIGAGNNFGNLLTSQNPIPLLEIPVVQATMISLPAVLMSLVVIILGKPIAIILNKVPKESIALSITMGIVEFLIKVVELLANTMSYARLGILLLVHAALLMVLNRALSLPLVVAVPLLVIFNILIMLLEGLIVYIQDLRLHMYEWFTKFYEGTGSLFRKMNPENIYYDIEWEADT